MADLEGDDATRVATRAAAPAARADVSPAECRRVVTSSDSMRVMVATDLLAYPTPYQVLWRLATYV